MCSINNKNENKDIKEKYDEFVHIDIDIIKDESRKSIDQKKKNQKFQNPVNCTFGSTTYERRRLGEEVIPGENDALKIGSWVEGFKDEVDEKQDLLKAKWNLLIYIVLYIGSTVGSVFFLVGSMCYLPLPTQTALGGGDHTDLGAYLFCAGVGLYMLCQMWSFINLFNRHLPGTRNTIAFYCDLASEIILLVAYLVGYLPGSILFISKYNAAALGAKCFVWGSAIISLGFFIQNFVFNYLNKVGGEGYINTQCDTTAFYCYILGATLWGCASVVFFLPNLETAGSEVYTFAAMMFIVGSCFFLFGCLVALFAMFRRFRDLNENLSLCRK